MENGHVSTFPDKSIYYALNKTKHEEQHLAGDDLPTMCEPMHSYFIRHKGKQKTYEAWYMQTDLLYEAQMHKRSINMQDN